MWIKSSKPYLAAHEDFSDEPHGTFVYAVVLLICAAGVIVFSRWPL